VIVLQFDASVNELAPVFQISRHMPVRLCRINVLGAEDHAKA
jgi:hypothetical protein